MALITDATTGWSTSITLTSDEIWQCRKGAVYVTTTTAPAADDGIALHEMHAVQFPAGVTISYRKQGTTEALIVREAL